MQKTEEEIRNTLRDEYYRCRAASIPRRAKGTHFLNIFMPFGAFGLILMVLEVRYSLSTRYLDKPTIWVIVLFTLWCFFILPENIYDERKRLPRAVFTQYPMIKPVIEKLIRPDNGEEYSKSIPIIDLNGNEYFLVGYLIRQKWWELQMKVDYTGLLLLDNQGNIIQSEDLFLKAYLVSMHAATGSVGLQRYFYGRKQQYSRMLKKTLPLAIKHLRKQESLFTHFGLIEEWQELCAGMAVLVQAFTEGNKYFDDWEKVCKSIGYSFGTRYYLEDARMEESMNQSFNKYMLASYEAEIKKMSVISFGLSRRIKKSKFWFSKRSALNALSTIRQAASMIAFNIVEAGQNGIPHKFEWKAYVERLKYARKLGLPVLEIGSFSEDYPNLHN